MKKVMMVTVFFIAALAAIAQADDVDARTGASMHEYEKEIINDTCPVMGGKVDNSTPYKTIYKGKWIGFCCPTCVEEFRADPEKYMARLKKKYVINCPECGAEIDITEQCEAMGKSSPMTEEKQAGEDEGTY